MRGSFDAASGPAKLALAAQSPTVNCLIQTMRVSPLADVNNRVYQLRLAVSYRLLSLSVLFHKPSVPLQHKPNSLKPSRFG
jgi:hypothetical protein